MMCPGCNKRYLDPPFQCIECKTQLGWTCTACQHGNPIHYHFCGKCGVAIPVGLSSLIEKGVPQRMISIPQYSDALIEELREERQRLNARRKVKNLSQNEIDLLF